MEPNYVFMKDNGTEIWCYGPLYENSNFDIACEDEEDDFIWIDRDPDVIPTWWDICMYFDQSSIEVVEITTI